MPRTLVALLVVGLLGSAARADEVLPSRAKTVALALGATPRCLDVRLPCTDGKARSIADLKGPKGTLILFICNHCPYVKAWQDRIVAACNGARAKGIGVLAVDANDPAMVPGDGLADMKQLAESKGYAFPYASDPTSCLARAFGASRTPEAFLIDADGRLVYHGTVDDSAQDPAAVTRHWLADAIDAVAAGREVPVKETKALGCAIKYAAE
jgi:peroxiredoxin